MNMNIFDLPRTEEESIIFLQNKGILPKERRNKKRGTVPQHMESYLAEFMWRQTIRNKDPFDSILDLIKTYSPPEINYN